MSTASQTQICANEANKRAAALNNIPPTRYTPISPYINGSGAPSISAQQYALNMRRKAEILQYKRFEAGKQTKKQSWAQIAKGAYQTKSQSALQAAADGASEPVCPPTLSTSAGVPGPPIYLYLDPTVPLYNYVVTHTYATENKEDPNLKWITIPVYDILSQNATLFTLNIQPPIDQINYTYSFTTSVGLRVEGTSINRPGTVDASGVFQVSIIPTDISVIVTYGGFDAALRSTPIASFSSGFLTNVTGTTPTTTQASTFYGEIYLGELTISNLFLATSPGYTYEITVHYAQSNSFNMSTFNSTFITGLQTRLTNTNKQITSGMTFSVTPPTTSIQPFSISGI